MVTGTVFQSETEIIPWSWRARGKLQISRFQINYRVRCVVGSQRESPFHGMLRSSSLYFNRNSFTANEDTI